MITLSAGSDPGTWRVSSVALHHGGAEVLRLTTEDLREAGYGAEVRVIRELPAAQAPDVRIIEPLDSSVHHAGETIDFHGRATTMIGSSEGGAGVPLPDSALVWTSSIDGQIGVGARFATAGLSEGEHTITLTATDEYGQRATDSITIRLDPGARLSSILIAPDTAGLARVGDSVQLEAQAFDQFGEEITGLVIEWSSLDLSVATVDEAGQVTARGFGATRIEARVGDLVGTAALGVGGPNVTISSPQYGEYFTIGETIDLRGSAVAQNGQAVADSSLVWTINMGQVLGIGSSLQIGTDELPPGYHSLELTATDAFGLTAMSTINFGLSEPPEVSFISIEPDRPVLNELGSTITLTATAHGMYENEIPNAVFTWSSLNTAIATVDANGVVTAHGFGTTQIRAESGGVSEEVTLRVLEIRPPITWDTIAAGESHSCGLAQGIAYCWGNNDYGGLGTGDTDFRLVPTPVAGGQAFSSISVGDRYTVALTATGAAYAWGYNGDGQLGDGTTDDRHTPVQVAGGNRFSAISAGGTHVLALTETAGHLYAWGNNSLGQLGDGSGSRSLVPTFVQGSAATVLSFDAISAGATHSVALSDGVVYAWGRNHWGQVGDRTTFTRTTPVALNVADETVASISAGGYHTVALTVDGKAYAWGYGLYGQIGIGTNSNYNTAPAEVAGGHTFTSISAGGNSTFGITAGGVAYGWGLNWYGNLGDGTSEGRNMPTRVGGEVDFASISVGSLHTLGLTAAGMAYGWGSNDRGALGDGTPIDRHLPTPVAGPSQ